MSDEPRGVHATSRFERLYQAHYRHVLAYARRRVDEQTARDVSAETFAITWRRFEVVPADQPLPWLYATARRVLANELRDERYRQQLTLHAHAAALAGVPTAIVSAIHPDHSDRISDHLGAREELTRAMAQLSPRDQEVLQLASWEDLDPATTATVLGCSTTAVKVRLHRARRRLREALHRARTTPTSGSPAPTPARTTEPTTVRTAEPTTARVDPASLSSLEDHR